MQSTALLPQITSAAVTFHDQIQEIIDINSDWWGKVDGKTDEKFGEYILSAMKMAEYLSNVTITDKNLPSVQKKITELLQQFENIIFLGDRLYDNYKNNNQGSDALIVETFINCSAKYREDFREITNSISDYQNRKKSGSSNKEKTQTPSLESLNNLPESNSPIQQKAAPASSTSPHEKNDVSNYLVWVKKGTMPLDEEFKRMLSDLTHNFSKEKTASIVVIHADYPTIWFNFKSVKTSTETEYNLQVDNYFNPGISVDDAKKAFPEFTKLNSADFPGYINSIDITSQEYHDLLRFCIYGSVNDSTSTSFLSAINPDTSSRDIVDQLDFESDVTAMASVIAYEKVQPPLAIGLFGNWGSGKSFFMNKLQVKIKELADNDDKTYCSKVVHVNFNSWHYSDANLWASLITKIFEDLQQYAKGGQQTMETLYQNLKSTKELIDDSTMKLGRITKEKGDLETAQKIIQQTINEKAATLESTKTKDILKAVWENDEVKGSVAEINKLLPDELITDIHTARIKLNELSSGSNQLVESLKIAYSSTKGKKVIGLIVFILVFAGTYIVYTYKEGFQQGINAVALKISALVSFLVQVIGFVTPAMGKIKTAYKSLKSLEKTFTELENKEKTEQQAQLVRLQKELDIKKEEQQKQEAILKELQQQEIKLQDEINDIISGKKLNRFIENKVTDPRYINSLGIISWIRKDFEELDFLLKIQHEADEKKLAELGRTKVDNIFKIDRIVLYIDDLDRCNEDIVVRVLEAIHLLLAFPLFVVVVGVDPRWMHNALSLKYKHFLQQKQGEVPQPFQIGETLFKEPATSFDYLEKIFQIPFALKPINDIGRKRLIDSQLGSIVKKEKDTGSNAEIKDTGSNGQQKKEQGDSGTNDVLLKNEQQQETHDSKKEKIKANPALLEISKEELDFMKDISLLIGDSPRTIKRYINIYRIIRSHARFFFYDKKTLDHYAAVMILLAIITGIPDLVGEIFKLIEDETKPVDFKVFITDNEKVFSKNPEAFVKLKKCFAAKCGDTTAGYIFIEKFKINLGLVSRFSFRYLD